VHLLVRELLDERHVVPVVRPLVDPGGAAEVVERDRSVAALGEAEREFLVEAVETADVRQDHDAGREVATSGAFGAAVFRPGVAGLAGGASSLRNCPERGELVAILAFEDEVVVGDGGARDPWDRRLGVEVEAHGARERTKGGAGCAAYPEGGGRRVAAGRDERRDPRPARAGRGAAFDAAAGGRAAGAAVSSAGPACAGA
jgi:hypothetical protein